MASRRLPQPLCRPLLWFLLSSTLPAVPAPPCLSFCTFEGTCNEDLRRCDCQKHQTGLDCQKSAGGLDLICHAYGFEPEVCTDESPGQCLNACNGRGTCLAGWCHCKPGFYGADCSLSRSARGGPQQLAGLGFKPSPKPPHIYIYELPPHYNTWRNIEKMDRPLYSHLWKRIISSGHRTLDGDHADYYYVPVDFRYLRKESPDVLRYVRETWPFWNRTGGANHLLLSTSDLGGCEGSGLMSVRHLTANATWLTPWGLHKKHPHVWWPSCHRPGQDIVLPVPALMGGLLRSPLNIAVTNAPPRTTTFFFAGKVCGDGHEPKPPGTPWPICQTSVNPWYSAGVRQQVYAHHAGRPGFKIVSRSEAYVNDMSSSIFCLAPTGGGHGKRQVLTARFGCIPVPITDNVLQPFQPELPWKEFSVPVAEQDVPRLHEILAAISDTKLKKMQKSLECAARHLWWSTVWGSIFGEDGRYDAFATLMEILRARLRHPGVPPENLIKVDPEFAKFARCELGDDTVAARAALAAGGAVAANSQGRLDEQGPPPGLCYYGYDPALLKYAPTGMCDLNKWGKYGPPGGAVCQGAPDLAHCPRPWE